MLHKFSIFNYAFELPQTYSNWLLIFHADLEGNA